MLSGRTQKVSNALSILLIFAVLGTPLLTITDVRLSGQVMFEVIIVLALAIGIAKINLWCGLFLILAFGSALHPFNTEDSIFAFRYVFFGILWYSVLVLTVKDVKWLLHGIRIICFVNIFWLGLQFFGLDPLTVPTKLWEETTLRVGLLANQNEVSALIAFCSPAFLIGRWKYFLSIVLLGLALTMTIGGTLSFFIGMAFYVIVTNPLSRFCTKSELTIILFMCFISMSFFYCVFISSPTFKRMEAWTKGIEFYKTRWIFGYGIGHWKQVFGMAYQHKVIDSWWVYAHNEFVQGLLEMGIGFAVIITGYLTNIFRRFTKETVIPITAIVIIIANCVVNFPFHIAQTAIVAITWMAILQIELEKTWVKRLVKNP